MRCDLVLSHSIRPPTHPTQKDGLNYETFLECLESVFDKLQIRRRAEAEVFDENELPAVEHVTRADKLQALADILDLEGTLFRSRYEAEGGGGGGTGGGGVLPRPKMERQRKAASSKKGWIGNGNGNENGNGNKVNRAGKAAPHGSVARQLQLLQQKLGSKNKGPESFDDDDGNRVVVHKHVRFA